MADLTELVRIGSAGNAASLSYAPQRIVYLGRLESYKRIGLLLRAVAQLSSRFPELERVLVGRGDERA